MYGPKGIGRHGLDVQNYSGLLLFLAGNKPALLDRPDLTDRVYNQVANDFSKTVMSNPKHYFWRSPLTC